MKFKPGIGKGHYIAAIVDGFYQIAPVGGNSTEYQLMLVRYGKSQELLGTHADKTEAMKRAREHYGEE